MCATISNTMLDDSRDNCRLPHGQEDGHVSQGEKGHFSLYRRAGGYTSLERTSSSLRRCSICGSVNVPANPNRNLISGIFFCFPIYG